MGVAVLVKQSQQNQLSTPFNASPYKLVRENGKSCTVETQEGTLYKRNSTHVQTYYEPKDFDPGVYEIPTQKSVFHSDGEASVTRERSTRNRKRPSYLQDYDLS